MDKTKTFFSGFGVLVFIKDKPDDALSRIGTHDDTTSYYSIYPSNNLEMFEYNC